MFRLSKHVCEKCFHNCIRSMFRLIVVFSKVYGTILQPFCQGSISCYVRRTRFSDEGGVVTNVGSRIFRLVGRGVVLHLIRT